MLVPSWMLVANNLTRHPGSSVTSLIEYGHVIWDIVKIKLQGLDTVVHSTQSIGSGRVSGLLDVLLLFYCRSKQHYKVMSM